MRVRPINIYFWKRLFETNPRRDKTAEILMTSLLVLDEVTFSGVPRAYFEYVYFSQSEKIFKAVLGNSRATSGFKTNGVKTINLHIF